MTICNDVETLIEVILDHGVGGMPHNTKLTLEKLRKIQKQAQAMENRLRKYRKAIERLGFTRKV